MKNQMKNQSGGWGKGRSGDPNEINGEF